MSMSREEMEHRINNMSKQELLGEFKEFLDAVSLRSVPLDRDMSVHVQAGEDASHEHLAEAVKKCAFNAGHTLGCGPMRAADFKDILRQMQEHWQQRITHPSFPDLTGTRSSE